MNTIRSEFGSFLLLPCSNCVCKSHRTVEQPKPQIPPIRTLKAGLSGIVRQHGFATVQDFYTAFYTAQRATDTYQNEYAKWAETYGEKATPKAETMHDKIKRYQEKADRQNANQPYRSRDRGAR